MHCSPIYALTDLEQIRRIVAEAGAGELVTADAAGHLEATLLPVDWDGDRLSLHMSRANPQWRAVEPCGGVLIIVTTAHAYISPSWYPSKGTNARVVPTWDYATVHLRGRATVREDAEWLRASVTRLTNMHESGRPEPWSVDDAPRGYIEKSLRAIVGLEIVVESVEAKLKLSQNRSTEDRAGAVHGLLGDTRASAQAIGRLIADTL